MYFESEKVLVYTKFLQSRFKLYPGSNIRTYYKQFTGNYERCITQTDFRQVTL